MPKVYYKKNDKGSIELEHSPDLIAVRTRSRKSITRSPSPVPSPLSQALADSTLVVAYPEAGVEVYRIPAGRGKRSMSDRKSELRESPDVQFAGGVLIDSVSKEPVLYTENLFVKFKDALDPEQCAVILREAGLTTKEQVSYATNGFFVAAQDGIGQKVFDLATELLQQADVEYAYPELIRRVARRAIFPQQWHLTKTTISGISVDAHANVEAAHEITRGEGTVIAVIDDGCETDHPEFSGPGKVVSPRDVTTQTNDANPKDSHPFFDDDHGTPCAGVACGNGEDGAAGVAPQAKLMPIRNASGLGSMREADAFTWAVQEGADVISCSWGPPDGRWWDPNEQSSDSQFPLPPHTQLAIENAVTNGRGGRGCVIFWAGGNGRESMNSDEYASNPHVIAVAACNDRGTRSAYSDSGKAIWCSFPSGDFGHAPFNHPSPLTTGIWTADRTGNDGYNEGNVADGDLQGDYTNSFGGTSSACPGAAGVAALVLAVNPELRWHEVKDVLKRCCDQIDPQGGNYDASGHSEIYGYGRLNARTAVKLAKPEAQSGVTISRRFDAPIRDFQTGSFELVVAEKTKVERLTVSLDIEHSYIGDLVVTLHPPASTGVGPVILHNRAGGPTVNLKRTYDVERVPAIANFAGKDCSGSWELEIRDAALRDTGNLVSYGLNLGFVHPSRAVTAPRSVSQKGPKKKKSRRARKKKAKR